LRMGRSRCNRPPDMIQCAKISDAVVVVGLFVGREDEQILLPARKIRMACHSQGSLESTLVAVLGRAV